MRCLQFSARVKPHSDLVLEAPFLFTKLLFAEDHIVIDSEESVRFVIFQIVAWPVNDSEQMPQRLVFLAIIAPAAEPGEVTTGPAELLCNVSGSEIRRCAVEIEALSFAGEEGRDLRLRVTDPELLAATGGIVQGMSGSPILQNGRLVGAVTHVLIGDPTRGYGIFIGHMLEVCG